VLGDLRSPLQETPAGNESDIVRYSFVASSSRRGRQNDTRWYRFL